MRSSPCSVGAYGSLRRLHREPLRHVMQTDCGPAAFLLSKCQSGIDHLLRQIAGGGRRRALGVRHDLRSRKGATLYPMARHRSRDNVRPPSVAMTRASSGEPNQKIPIVSPAAKAAPSSLHRLRSSGGTDFGAKIASGVCACVQTMMGSAMARSRQPVAMRSI